MKFPKNILFIVFLSGSFILNVFAQCEGVFFKTTNREIYASSPLANFAPEFSPVMSLQKDITGDGKIDLIGGGILQNEIYIAPGEGNGNFGALIRLSRPNQSAFYVEDFTGDGLKDFLIQISTNTPTYRIYRNNGGGTSFTPLAPTALPNGFEIVRNVVDINNDNRADIMFDNNFRLANADGTFAPPITIGIDFKFPIDFNNDGFTDFVQVRNSTLLSIAYNNGNGTFTLGPGMTTIGNNAAILAVADFNNDSKPDILARNSSQAFFYISSFNNGYFESTYPINPDTANIFMAADFTGDGFKDVLIKPAQNLLSSMNPTKPAMLLTNNGSGIFTVSTPVGDVARWAASDPGIEIFRPSPV